MSKLANKLDSVQCLRGIAAMSVFILHMQFVFPMMSDEATRTVANVVANGYFGVDVFFVISGFILAWVSVLSRTDGTVRVLEFGIKRFFRLAPSYWLTLVVFAYLLNRDTSTINLIRMMFFYPLGDMVAPYYTISLNNVGWTLNYEVAFYLIFGLCLMFGRYSLLAVTAIILGFVFLTPLYHGATPTLNPMASTDYRVVYLRVVSNPLMLEFLLGIAVAWLYVKFRDRAHRALGPVFMVIGGGALLVVAHYTTERAFSVLGAALPAAILLLGMTLAEHNSLIRIPKVAVWLGDISFALYLTHWALWEGIVKDMPVPAGAIGRYGQAVVFIAVGLCLAYVWKRFIEDPTAVWGRRLWAPSRAEGNHAR